MKSEVSAKAFDCVKWTRRTRDRISAEIRNMSPDELRQWIKGRRPADPFLAELFDRRKPPTGRRASSQASGGPGAALQP